MSLADELFFNLDGRLLEVGGASWSVEVCGIHSGANEHWVQLNLSGPLEAPLTVRTATLDASSVLQDVSNWLERGYCPTLENVQ